MRRLANTAAQDMDPSQDELKMLLSYDAETGVFTRIKALTSRAERHVGKPCGTLNRTTGYCEIQVGGRLRYAHRLAWIYCHGQIPDGAMIDHANRDQADNRISNLRIASRAENLRNCKIRVDNTSGVKGVSYSRRRGKWEVSVGRRYIGRFDNLFEAACARRSAALAEFGCFANE